MVSKTIGRGFESFRPCQLKIFMQLIDYFRNVAKEVKNITFPNRQDVRITSVIVVFMTIIFMLFISCADFVISRLIKILLGIL